MPRICSENTVGDGIVAIIWYKNFSGGYLEDDGWNKGVIDAVKVVGAPWTTQNADRSKHERQPYDNSHVPQC